MSFLGPSSDAPFAERLAAVPRSRWIIAGLSLAVTLVIATGFLLESRWGYSGRVVKVVYFKSWDAGRSAADVARDTAGERTALATAAAQSRAYIATLPAAKQTAARAQYDAYMKAQPAELKP